MTGRAVHVIVRVLIGLELAWWAFVVVGSMSNASFGLDRVWHMDASRRLWELGTPYWPWQLEGPFVIANGAILYPPIAFALFTPFLWLPAAAWWFLPLAITAFAMTRHRPPAWTWTITLGLFCLPSSLNVYVFGNPTMWLVAAVAAGTVWYWPFALLVMKPTFAPLALLGIRHRSWWVAMAVIALISLPFGRVWCDWFTVVGNSNVSLTYNLPTLPLALAPLVPWVTDPRGSVRNRLGR